MLKDIEEPKVEGVAMAVVPGTDEEGGVAWHVYLVNNTGHPLENVLVSSRGYGEIDGETRRTSEMRHHLETLGPKSWARIERIVEDVFPLTNQYWLSFYRNKTLYDKKYIFLAGSIDADNFTTVPLMGERGVMIE
ncbi:MAG: hypothetical protein R2815_11185 [Flavobacteriales bacterium]